MSDDHFTVDGTLIPAWASQKSFRPEDGSDKDGDGTNFHRGKRSNETRESPTGPDARLSKKSYGTESKLACLGQALVEKTFGWGKQTGPAGRIKACKDSKQVQSPYHPLERQMPDCNMQSGKKLLVSGVPPRDVASNLGVSVRTDAGAFWHESILTLM